MILCCGEALIDMVPLPDRETGFLPCPGGSPYNTAIAIGRLGTPAQFLGRLSKDFFGELLVEKLRTNSVNTSLIVRSDERSTLAFVKLEAGKEPQYIFYTEGTADRSFSPADLPAVLPDEVRGILFGSIAMTMEPVATAIETLIFRETARGQNAPVISIDPNIRPFMIQDSDAYRKRFEEWVKASTIVKISSADLDFIYPGLGLEEALQRLLKLGPRLTAVTQGAEGALALLRRDSGEIIRVRAPAVKVRVKDTIGAGDTFHGGLLAWLELNGYMSRSKLERIPEEAVQSALVFANTAASLVCTRQGAEPPTFSEVKASLF
ncbi:MAG: carbohydrate kinase [Spirochaetaceae bacterium]|jgi:fructokinase|nr:carbohydrate kinase [Spirochaetaceae bacterium]